MNSLSADDVVAGSAKVSSWIPQVFFDLIARVIPGSLALILLAVSLVGVDRSVSLVSTWLEKDLGFPSILIILIVMMGASYIYAVSAWGMWYGTCVILRKLCFLDKKADPETLVVLRDQNFPELYEKIKTYNPVAGNRLTKLKAEIHMAGTLIISGVLALLIVFIEQTKGGDGNWLYFVVGVFLGLLGLFSALTHFVRRSTQIVENARTKDGSSKIA